MATTTMMREGWLGVLLGLAVGCGGSNDDGGVWNSGDGANAESSAAGDTRGGDDHDPDGTSAGADDATVGDAADDGILLDVGAPDGDFDGCGCALSYLWVANSEQGTVSKINTVTLEEEGRYLTRADGAGDPSRTSVNLAGDVAVANRRGGLVKFWAEVGDCQESNGVPGIQTSSGADDVLAWNMEECRAWYRDFPTSNQRPVAWTGGTAGPTECDADDAQVWTVTSTVTSLFPGLGGPGGVTVSLLDGDDGTSVEEIDIAAEVFNGTNFGAYGGAVDAQGNLYFTSMGFSGGVLGRVRKSDLAVATWPIPAGIGPYGITVDHDGRPWLSSTLGAGAGRLDPDTGTWDVVEGFWGGSGLAEGPDNRMYVSAGGGVYAVDLGSLAVEHVFSTPEVVKGVGFDGEGYLWAVTWQDVDNPTAQGGVAFKVDPSVGAVVDFYNGLDLPYTYSDMTGKALGTVTCPPAG